MFLTRRAQEEQSIRSIRPSMARTRPHNIRHSMQLACLLDLAKPNVIFKKKLKKLKKKVNIRRKEKEEGREKKGRRKRLHLTTYSPRLPPRLGITSLRPGLFFSHRPPFARDLPSSVSHRYTDPCACVRADHADTASLFSGSPYLLPFVSALLPLPTTMP